MENGTSTLRPTPAIRSDKYPINGSIGVILTPNADWMEKYGEAFARGEQMDLPPEEDCIANFVLVGAVWLASALTPQTEWPASGGAVVPLAAVPVRDLVRRFHPGVGL